MELLKPPAMCMVSHDILDGYPAPSQRCETALWLALECWGLELDEEHDNGRESLKGRVLARWKQDLRDDGYGFVWITFLAITVLAAAIEWAVQRLLDWLYPEGFTNFSRREQLLRAKRGAA